MNSCNFAGNLGRDWNSRYTTDGNCVATNSIAEKNYKGDTVWVPVTAFGKTAETLVKYTSKGTPLGLTCEYSTGSYEKDGNTVYTHTFVVKNFTFLGSGNKKQSQKQEPGKDQHGNGFNTGNNGYHAPQDDTIPFFPNHA